MTQILCWLGWHGRFDYTTKSIVSPAPPHAGGNGSKRRTMILRTCPRCRNGWLWDWGYVRGRPCRAWKNLQTYEPAPGVLKPPAAASLDDLEGV